MGEGGTGSWWFGVGFDLGMWAGVMFCVGGLGAGSWYVVWV